MQKERRDDDGEKRIFGAAAAADGVCVVTEQEEVHPPKSLESAGCCRSRVCAAAVCPRPRQIAGVVCARCILQPRNCRRVIGIENIFGGNKRAHTHAHTCTHTAPTGKTWGGKKG